MRPPSLILFTTLTALLVAGIARPELADAAHEVGNFVRQSPKGADYSLHVPASYNRSIGATAIVLLHGAGDSHTNFMNAWRGNRFMSEWIAIVVNAEANGTWEPSDVPRVMDVLDEVERDYSVRRVFVGGFSRGGFFSYRVGLSHVDRFAGLMCLAGGLSGAGGLVKAESAQRIAVAIVHGEADNVVSLENATQARARFEKAGWKNLYFKAVPGLAHRIDPQETRKALEWLDQNAQALRTPQDYYQYGVNMYKQGDFSRAYWAFTEIHTEENAGEKFYKKTTRYLGKIDKKSSSEGKKILKSIEDDKNARWIPRWTAYDGRFAGTRYHVALLATYEQVVARHHEQADQHAQEAATASEVGEVEIAIRQCLKIRDECYLASGESVQAARALLARYRDDPAIRKKHRALLKGTEKWQ